MSSIAFRSRQYERITVVCQGQFKYINRPLMPLIKVRMEIDPGLEILNVFIDDYVSELTYGDLHRSQ